MKRILGLLSVLLFINACDDGDLTVENIDFGDINASRCTNKDILYKISDAKMLILAIPLETFVDDETAEDTPIEVPLSSTVEVIYRQYNGSPSSENICPTIPSASPNLVEEWVATAGTVQITSTAVKSVNASTGVTQITGYKHYVVFKNISFQKPDGSTQTYETYVFGNYIKTVSPLSFNFGEEANKSTCDDRIFNFNTSEALILDFGDYANLFQNSATTTPRTALISATNKVTYRLYSGTINDAYYCSGTTPATPLLSQEWTANNGVENVSGMIEVTTTVFGAGFMHTIHLKKVTMSRGNSDFYLGDDYLYGSFVVTP